MTNDFGLSPIHWAAASGHQEITEFLIQHGSDVIAQNYFHETALHFAAGCGNKNVAEVLIRYGSDVNFRNKFGETPLHWAAWNGHQEMTEFLIQHGSDFMAQNYFHETALHLAARFGNENLAESLIRYGSDVNAINHQQHTPLYLAALNGHKNVVEVLIRYGSDVNVTNDFGLSPIHWAAKNGHQEITEFFIQHGSDVIAQNYFHETANHFAAGYGNKSVAEVLIRYGSDVNVTNYFGKSHIHRAAESGHQEITEFLIQRIMDENGSKVFVSSVFVNTADNLTQAPYESAESGCKRNKREEINKFYDCKSTRAINRENLVDILIKLTTNFVSPSDNQAPYEFDPKPAPVIRTATVLEYLEKLSMALGNVSGQRIYKLKLNKLSLSLSRDGGDAAYLNLGLVIKCQGTCETAYRVKCCSLVTSSCIICPTIPASNERTKDRDDDEEKMCSTYSFHLDHSKYFLQVPSNWTGYILLRTLVISISSAIVIYIVLRTVLDYLRTNASCEASCIPRRKPVRSIF